jgi:nucleotide-binding universal stress UspA family protein
MGAIVVGTDGSESARSALQTAIRLAHQLGDRLVLVTAWRELRGDFHLPVDTLLPALKLAEVEREWADGALSEARAAAEEAGVEAETVRVHGDPATAICDAVQEHCAHLIVVGARGWGPVEGLLFGSVSRSVLTRAACPVLVIPESYLRAQAVGAESSKEELA